jgi:hypothetical protein
MKRLSQSEIDRFLEDEAMFDGNAKQSDMGKGSTANTPQPYPYNTPETARPTPAPSSRISIFDVTRQKVVTWISSGNADARNPQNDSEE